MRNATVFSLDLRILLTSICNDHFKEYCHSFPKSYWLGSLLIVFLFTQRNVYWTTTLATFSCFFLFVYFKGTLLVQFSSVDWGDFEGPCRWVCQSVKIQQTWMDSLFNCFTGWIWKEFITCLHWCIDALTCVFVLKGHFVVFWRN